MTDQEAIPPRPIYMDHNATTPVDPRVLETMLPYFTEIFGNAASVDHDYGSQAARAVETARQQVASAINARPDEIIFTSGATESDNLAILGAVEQNASRGNHIITCVTEHKAVLDTCAYLGQKGCQITYVPVDQQGVIDPDDVRRAITPGTVLISIMMANNEIGVIAPIGEIGRIAKEHQILFHTDAAQAVGHVPVDVEALGVDLMSLSAHKVYGPKGVGALYVRGRSPRVRIAEQIHGGGHERNMRSGTLNVPGIVGFGRALQIAGKEMGTDGERLRMLRDRMWAGLQAGIDGVQLNGHPTQRLPHNLSASISGIESRSVLIQLKTYVALSTGSACSTARVEPSHVILALGYDERRAYSSIRFGLGRSNTEADVEFVVPLISMAVNHLRRMSVN